MAKQQMTVNDLRVLRNELVGIRDVFRKTIKNASIKNDEGSDDPVEVIDIEEEQLAGPGDIVQVAPIVEGEPDYEAPSITGEIIEIVEEDTEPADTPVENTRYQRITNCKVLRTKNGGYEVLCPVKAPTNNAAPKAAKPKRYVRLVNRKSSCNSDQVGRTIDDMQVGVKYTPAYATEDYATVTKNIARIDALLSNALSTGNATSIKDSVKTEIDEALKETGITKNAQKRYIRTKNYRTVKNAEGQLEVIIDASKATDCTDTSLEKTIADSIADANIEPIEKTLETPASPITVEVVMDGIPVAKTENKATPKAVTTHNAAAPPISIHPELQPFLASNADLQAMLALAQYCENPGNIEQLTKTDVNTFNAEDESISYGDAAPLEMPTLFPSK